MWKLNDWDRVAFNSRVVNFYPGMMLKTRSYLIYLSMRKLTCFLGIISILLSAGCERTGLKKYYTRISPEEFASYDSVVVSVKSKYGKVYHAYKRSKRRFMNDFLVFEKSVDGEKTALYKMQGDVEVKNDSTFIMYGSPLLVIGDTVNWVKGLWFYRRSSGGTTFYSTDSVPHNAPEINYQTVPTGIYKYAGGKLIKVSSKQTEEALDEENAQGFIYLPNPGRFFELVRFDQVK